MNIERLKRLPSRLLPPRPPPLCGRHPPPPPALPLTLCLRRLFEVLRCGVAIVVIAVVIIIIIISWYHYWYHRYDYNTAYWRYGYHFIF